MWLHVPCIGYGLSTRLLEIWPQMVSSTFYSKYSWYVGYVLTESILVTQSMQFLQGLGMLSLRIGHSGPGQTARKDCCVVVPTLSATGTGTGHVYLTQCMACSGYTHVAWFFVFYDPISGPQLKTPKVNLHSLVSHSHQKIARDKIQT